MYPVEHIWAIIMLKILQAHLLRTFVANLKIYTIYALCPEFFCNKNLAIRKVSFFLTLVTLDTSSMIIRGTISYLEHPGGESIMNSSKPKITAKLLSGRGG